MMGAWCPWQYTVPEAQLGIKLSHLTIRLVALHICFPVEYGWETLW